jgi:lysophospholipase L1-like esterase
VRHRHPSSRSAAWLALVSVLVATLAAACATSRSGSEASSDPLPTGIVGPVQPTAGPEALRYVALGDPYTFGDGVRQSDRWPNQLVRILRPQLDLDLIANLATRGAYSRDLIDDQLPALEQLEPQFVSIQAGANDACQPVDPALATYRDNLESLLDAVVALVGADRIVMVTAPDFTLVPKPPTDVCAGDAAEQAEQVRQANAILEDVARSRGVAVADITSIADRVPRDPSLVASDGAHPSSKQYAGWADLVAEQVRPLFREPVASAVPAAKVAPSGARDDASLQPVAAPSISPSPFH